MLLISLVHVIFGLQRSSDAFEDESVAGLERDGLTKCATAVAGVMEGEKLWNIAVRIVVLFVCQVEYAILSTRDSQPV